MHTVFHYHAFDDILKEYLYLKYIYEKVNTYKLLHPDETDAGEEKEHERENE